MNTQEIAKVALDTCLSSGADEAVTLANNTDSRQIKFVNNKLDINKAWTTISADIILVKDRKVAVTSIKDCSRKCIKKTVRKLVKFAERLEPSQEYRGIAEGPFKYKKVQDGFDSKIRDLKEESVDLIESAINAALGEGAERANGVLDYGITESALRTSNNVEVSEKATSISLSIRALKNKQASGHKITCSRMMKDFNPAKAGRDAGSLAVKADNPGKIEPGKYTILFDSLPFADLVNQVVSAAPMTSVESGMSFLVQKLNKQVASSNFTLWDDGHIPGGLASSKSDTEGVPTQRTTLIRDGVLESYLHNTSTAKKYETKTTANAGIISPSPTNAVVKKGDKTIEELMDEIEKGLYVTNTWYTRFQNYVTGDFSTIPRDAILYIENGEVKQAVNDIRISDNLLRIMKNISGIGNDVRQIHGWGVSIPTFTPSVRVDKVRVTKSKFKTPAQVQE